MCFCYEVDYEVVEEGERCRCGGEVHPMQSLARYNLWRGKCAICHRLFDVIRLSDNGG